MVFPFLMSIISCVSVVRLYLPGHLSVAILKQKWTYYFCLRAQRKYLSILISLNHQPLHARRDALKTITPLKSHEQCFKVSMQGSAVLRAVQQSFWMSKASGAKHHIFVVTSLNTPPGLERCHSVPNEPLGDPPIQPRCFIVLLDVQCEINKLLGHQDFVGWRFNDFTVLSAVAVQSQLLDLQNDARHACFPCLET